MPDPLDKYAIGNDGLTNGEIAMLVEIGQSGQPESRSPTRGDPAQATAKRQEADAELERLLAFGFVERGDDRAPNGTARYQLTPAGQQFLSARGAGLNEA